MQSLLADFLNHGILPFMGRSAEIERIDEFWRSAADAHELRAALIIGEAGIGKSKLIEEIVPRIVRSGGAVVHTRLYPDAATSIAPLVARALRVLSRRRQLQIGGPDDTIPSVAMTMRRLARLRPTILIIEDLHLLEHVALREFSLLLEALADEPIAFLAAARPADLPARAILERYFVEEIELKGLSEESLGELWNALFITPAGPDLLAPLRGATLGNPLALRSALRGAIRAGSLSHDLVTNRWRSTSSPGEFARSLRKHVELLSEGMAAHLSAGEKEGGAMLASLGEVFARETAEMMLADRPGVLESLIFKGIIAPATTQSSPLLGEEPDQFPFAFTHTLIHRQFVEHARADARRLTEVVASPLPLYSVLPFQLLSETAAEAAVPPAVRRAAINRALACSISLDQGTDWKLAGYAVEAASRLVDTGEWEEEERRFLQLRVLRFRLSSLRRDITSDDYRALVERMDAMSSDANPALAGFRIMAYMHRFRQLRFNSDIDACMTLWNAVAAIIGKFPELRHSNSYMAFLQAAVKEPTRCSTRMAPLVERELESILAGDPPPAEDLVLEAKTLIYPYLLTFYSTPEELERRERMLRELDTMGSRHEPTITIQKIKFLIETGRMAEAGTLAAASRPWFKELGLIRNAINCAIFELAALALQGLPLDVVAAQIERIVADAPAELTAELRAGLGGYFAFVGLLRGDIAWGRKMMLEYSPGSDPATLELRVALATGEEPGALIEETLASDKAPAHLRSLARVLSGATTGEETALAGIREFLHRPLLSIHDILPRYAAMAMVSWSAHGTRAHESGQDIAADLCDAVEELLAWYESRTLPALMPPLLERHGGYCQQKRRARWEKIIGDLAGAGGPPAVPLAASARQTLTMLGAIELRGADGTATQIRGSRLRALLGLLVADRMLDQPLSHREMAAILSGADDDPDKARKTLNGVVFRLREAIGNDAILTDRDTPRLNTDLLAVDLLDAHAALQEAITALDERSLARAVQGLARAITISRGDVAFPTLYENFFEALREDFENQLRRVAIRVSKGLIEEGDPRSAEELLRLALKGMPGDEEIAELLQEALLMLGKRAEAERVKLQTALELG